jgi:hypothetical protein
MKASEIFNDCHGRYRGLREWLADATGASHSLDLDKPSSGYLWRPDRARACDYVADFERIARHALRRPEWKGRLKLFNICFVHSVEYRRAVRMVGVSEGTFDYWYAEVKRAADTEFARSELFPPWRYFLRRNQQPASVSTSESRPAPNREPKPERKLERKPEKKFYPRRAHAQSTAGASSRTPQNADGREMFVECGGLPPLFLPRHG